MKLLFYYFTELAEQYFAEAVVVDLIKKSLLTDKYYHY